MARYRYFLHCYDAGLGPVQTFCSRQALRNFMCSLPYSPSELADKYFLNVVTPRYSAIYHFKTFDNVHLSAVLSCKSRRF